MGRSRTSVWQRQHRDARRQAIRTENAEFLSDLRNRYPRAGTEHAVLISHVIHSDSVGDALSAACVGYSLGLRSAKKALIARAEALSSALVKNEDGYATVEHKLFAFIAIIIAAVDSPRSHSALLQLFGQTSLPWLRADVLEAMAWEKSVFDVEFVLSKADAHHDPYEIASALYALLFFGYGSEEPEITRDRIAPLLQHPHWVVRCHAINLLALNPESRELVESCLNDENPNVRDVAQDDLRHWFSVETPPDTETNDS